MSLNVLPSPKAATELSIDLFEAGVQMSPLVFPLLPQKLSAEVKPLALFYTSVAYLQLTNGTPFTH